MHAETLGEATPEQRASTLWALLKSSRQHLLKDGKPIEGDEASVAELTRRHEEWITTQRPLLKSLGVL